MARTRYQRGDQANSDCTPSGDINKPALASNTGTTNTQTATIVTQAMDTNEASFTFASGDPGGENLGAGSLFRFQIDAVAAGSNLTYRVEFHALGASCTSLGSAAQGEAAFSGTGLKLATATWDPPAGADRYQARILISHGGMHGDPSETLVIHTNTSDAWFEIPDAPVAATWQPTPRRSPLTRM